MPWTMNDFPSSMKNSKPAIRKKAIDIANTMVSEGYDENRAIPIATNQAKEWFENADSREIEKFKNNGDPTESSEDQNSRPELLDKGEHVVPHENGWAVQARDAKQPSEVFDSKSDAVKRGKEIAKNKGTGLTIHRKDGTIEDRQSYET